MDTGELTFSRLLQKLDKEEFKKYLEQETSIKKHERQQFLDFIEELIKTKPESDGIEMELYMYYQDPGEGLNIAVREVGTESKYALDFVPWTEVLSYKINYDTVKQYSLEEIAFLALYDMSFDGFEESSQKNNLNKLLKRVSNIFH